MRANALVVPCLHSVVLGKRLCVGDGGTFSRGSGGDCGQGVFDAASEGDVRLLRSRRPNMQGTIARAHRWQHGVPLGVSEGTQHLSFCVRHLLQEVRIERKASDDITGSIRRPRSIGLSHDEAEVVLVPQVRGGPHKDSTMCATGVGVKACIMRVNAI